MAEPPLITHRATTSEVEKLMTALEADPALRVQTRCGLTVRLSWTVSPGHYHPEHTFTCAEDVAMAVDIARNAALGSTADIAFAGLSVAADGGRLGVWTNIPIGDA